MNRLEAAVLFAVQHQVHLAVSYSEIDHAASIPLQSKKASLIRLDDLIAAKERELTKINTLQAISLSGLERR